MAYGEKPTLKKHCVDVSKYSTDVFGYFLSTLFGLAISNNQLASFYFSNFVDFQTFKSLDLQPSISTSITPFGFNCIVHDHDMWAIIDHVESCDVVEPFANLDFSIELDPTFFTSFYNPYVVLTVEDFDSLVHFESFHPKFKVVPLLYILKIILLFHILILLMLVVVFLVLICFLF
jgi:hypothetical protein